jgi:alanyl-tRNA synthetase
MAERLYLDDPYLTRFEAEVVAERDVDGRPAVALSRTAFYPEGGGQPADRGAIGGTPVIDVRDVDGEVLHLLDGPAPRGRVAGEVDWPRRFDHMQQHHGQHLLSAAFERLLGAGTVSFHLGEEVCTIDLDVAATRLGPATLREVEAACNATVWADLPVEARDLSPEELSRLPLRKEPSKGSRVVIVGEAGPERAAEEPGPARRRAEAKPEPSMDPGGRGLIAPPRLIDASPCGGTHPRRTGEAGCVAVLRAQKWAAGARVEFLCGGRAVRALAGAHDRLARVAGALRCAPHEAPEAAARIADESVRLRREAERLALALAAAEAERLAQASPGAVLAELFPPGGPAPAFLRAVASALAAAGRTAVLGTREPGRAHLCFARPRGQGPSAGEAVRLAAERLGGKGGGSPELGQGSGPDGARLGEALALGAEKLAG